MYEVTMENIEAVKSLWLGKADHLRNYVLTPITLGRLACLADIIKRQTKPELLTKAILRVNAVEDIVLQKEDIFLVQSWLQVRFAGLLTIADVASLDAIYDKAFDTDSVDELKSVRKGLQHLMDDLFLRYSL